MSYDYEDERDDSIEPASISKGEGSTLNVVLDSYAVDRVIDGVAQRLANSMRREVSDLLKAKVDRLWEDTIRAKAEAMATQFMTDFAEKPRHMTNTYGERNGQTFTFAERVTKTWDAFLAEKVKPDGSRDPYSDRNTITRAEQMVRAIVDKDVAEGTKAAVAKISEAAKARVQESVSRYIADQLAPRIDLPGIKG